MAKLTEREKLPYASILKQDVMVSCQVTSVVSDSVRPHRWQPTRLRRPWDSPGQEHWSGLPLLELVQTL